MLSPSVFPLAAQQTQSMSKHKTCVSFCCATQFAVSATNTSVWLLRPQTPGRCRLLNVTVNNESFCGSSLLDCLLFNGIMWKVINEKKCQQHNDRNRQITKNWAMEVAENQCPLSELSHGGSRTSVSLIWTELAQSPEAPTFTTDCKWRNKYAAMPANVVLQKLSTVKLIDWCFTARQHKKGQFVPIYQGITGSKTIRVWNTVDSSDQQKIWIWRRGAKQPATVHCTWVHMRDPHQ